MGILEFKKNYTYSFRWFWQMVHLPHEGELRNSTPTRLSIIQLKIQNNIDYQLVLYIIYNNPLKIPILDICIHLIFICFPGIRIDAASNSSKVCNWTFELWGPHFVRLFWLKWQVTEGEGDVVIVPSAFTRIMIALLYDKITLYTFEKFLHNYFSKIFFRI